MAVHWLEIIAGREICQGKDFTPKEDPTHYARWKAGGIELCEKVPTRTAQKSIDWQMAEEARAEYLLELHNQDW